MPIDRLFDLDRSVESDRTADVIFNIVLAPFEKIMVAFAPAHHSVVIADGAQGCVEFSRVARYRGSQYGLAKSHAIERVVAHHKLFRPPWSSDQRIALIACAAQRAGNELEPLRDRAFTAGFIDQAADPRFCSGAGRHPGGQNRTASEKVQDVSAAEAQIERHLCILPPFSPSPRQAGQRRIPRPRLRPAGQAIAELRHHACRLENFQMSRSPDRSAGWRWQRNQ